MEAKRCVTCHGGGKIMGGGMMMKDCQECGGTGKILPKEPIKVTIDKKSKSYKDSIKKLKDIGVPEKEAERVFEEEFARQAKNEK